MTQDYLVVKSVETPGCDPYYYAERKGRDSVAFIGYDPFARKFLVINEYKPPIQTWLTTAFGGSIDKPHKSLIQIVQAELYEEAGYNCTWDDISLVGSPVFVSTQMNQWCHLFYVKFKLESLEDCHYTTNGLSPLEAKSIPMWLSEDDVFNCTAHDWKINYIITKAGLL